jgi:tetratricopeptide (TPR) repeat protein
LGKAYYFAGQATKNAKDTLSTIALGQKADSVFALIPGVNATYTLVNIWRARANSYIDLDQTKFLAIPHYQKFIEVGDKDKNKTEMFEALTALGRHNLVTVKDSPKALEYLNKAFELKPEDAYLKTLMDGAKGVEAPAPTPVPAPGGAAVPASAAPAGPAKTGTTPAKKQ